MICPACDQSLVPKGFSDIVVDVCEGHCGGIWFDNFELEKVDEQHEGAGEELLNMKRDPSFKIDHAQVRICPSCEIDTKMFKHFFSVKMQVEIDECQRCGGVWLDFGELGKIRELYKNEEERREAAKKYFQDIFREDLEEAAEKREERLQKARKFANMFRFICPSYYIPGDQDWGAF